MFFFQPQAARGFSPSPSPTAHHSGLSLISSMPKLPLTNYANHISSSDGVVCVSEAHHDPRDPNQPGNSNMDMHLHQRNVMAIAKVKTVLN